MRNLKLFGIILLLTMTLGCAQKGDTVQRLYGNEAGLPPELKGLKVYRVATSGMNEIKVAVLPGYTSTSSTYPVGKTTQTTILFSPQNGGEVRTILAKEILVENDSIVVIRKK